MGNFSRNTFDKLKHYVGVRLQQGVPIVDADWNELEDIRKYELQAFLKEYVGNGIPQGNDGFHILPAVGENNFTIKGGDGTRAGRCLVEGWDVINESDLQYKDQRLFKDPGLHEVWDVDPLPVLTTPAADRTDTVYLDVWEREVDYHVDSNLVNPDIGIETCVRIKREWVVRVAERASAPPAAPVGHVFYVLAQFARQANEARILPQHITDRRRTGLSLISTLDMDQIVKDAYGKDYTLGHQGLPQLGISLRDAVNAALWGRLPATYEQIVYTSDLNRPISCVQILPSPENPLRDATLIWTCQAQSGKPQIMTAITSLIDGSQTPAPLTGDTTAYEGESITLRDGETTWVFWLSNRQNPGGNQWHVYSRRYTSSQGWGSIEGPLGEAPQPCVSGDSSDSSDSSHLPVHLSAFRHSQGGIWLLWIHKDKLLRLRRYAGGQWSEEERVSNAATSGSSPINGENAPKAVEWVNSVVLFWETEGPDWPFYKIWYRHYYYQYFPETGGAWQATTPARLTTDSSYSEELPQAFRDGAGSLWLFWRSLHQSGGHSYDYYIYAVQDLNYSRLYDLKAISKQIVPVLFDNKDNHFSAFLASQYQHQIWHKNYDNLNNQWSGFLDISGGDITSLVGGCPDGAGGAWLAYLKSATGNQTQLVVRKVYGRL
ncbi:MAG: DUF6519 domain-containing protein [Methylococcales bacterium]|nr:DUF6519 domain-containing protein [Methylococcales bacterium]